MIGIRRLKTAHPKSMVSQDDGLFWSFRCMTYEDSGDAAGLVRKVLSNKDFWDTDLTGFSGLEAAVNEHLNNILDYGIKEAILRL